MTKQIHLFTILLISISSVNAQCLSGDCENGEGKMKYLDNDIYVGNFLNGLRHGRGFYYDYDGEMHYEILFEEGVKIKIISKIPESNDLNIPNGLVWVKKEDGTEELYKDRVLLEGPTIVVENDLYVFLTNRVQKIYKLENFTTATVGNIYNASELPEWYIHGFWIKTEKSAVVVDSYGKLVNSLEGPRFPELLNSTDAIYSGTNVKDEYLLKNFKAAEINKIYHLETFAARFYKKD